MDKNDEIAIEVSGVSKKFKLPHEKQSSLKGAFLSSFKSKRYETQNALKDINFSVKKGEFFGIVGRNGSGKSTLLKCIAGVYTPNRGSIKINGSLVPFIELGVGFNPELSGRDNIYLNGALIGFSRAQMDKMYDEIVEFAELEDFMDQKLKNYSSGMQVRLAFSIAIRAKSDILLLDEVLAVGDAVFQQKCFDYFNMLKKEKQTILLVSHNVEVIKQYCDGGILVENGKIICIGDINEVVDDYLELIDIHEKSMVKKSVSKKITNNSRRGTGSAKVISVSTYDKDLKNVQFFGNKIEEVVISVEYMANENIESPVYGLVIKDPMGRTLISTNSLRLDKKTSNLKKDEKITTWWYFPNIFNNGEYTISPAIADKMGQEMFDWVDDMISFRVRKRHKIPALINIKHKMHIDKARSN